MIKNSGALGILMLQDSAQTRPGTLFHPSTFPFPTICRRVSGAWVSNVVFGGEDDKMAAAFIAAAKELVRDGAVAITSNCGFTIKYQEAMTRALSVRVSMSSLLLLPYLAATTKGRIGILSFDSRPLTTDVLRSAGVQSHDRIAIAGIEKSKTWQVVMAEPENDRVLSKATKSDNVGSQLAEDVLTAITLLRKRHDDIEVLLFECAGFPVVAQEVRKRTGLPVYDAVSNAKLLMDGLG
ncbi:hypothetical protein CI1B_29310 [Bradyrhizobium ivorense]|uniref:Glutamate racemase n=1 Tax=Bradyrhizobium ivorense TaxID=2511166 RepID=A0A508T578_9BRAD|nr:hypothetical protein [Bradyrhizobium ivorense]VIO70059.1 hypothetical protein CI1B_29310 [Bradyrhizobium ivorense]